MNLEIGENYLLWAGLSRFELVRYTGGSRVYRNSNGRESFVDLLENIISSQLHPVPIDTSWNGDLVQSVVMEPPRKRVITIFETNYYLPLPYVHFVYGSVLSNCSFMQNLRVGFSFQESSRLFLPPLGNIELNGNVCLNRCVVPGLQNVISYFWQSAFGMAVPVKGVGGRPLGFLLDEKAAAFYENWANFGLQRALNSRAVYYRDSLLELNRSHPPGGFF